MEIVTNIGNVALTNNQILNWTPLGIWKRFSYINGEVLGVSDTEPQQGDIDTLKTQLASLPDVPPPPPFDLIAFQGYLSDAAVKNQFSMDDPIPEFAPINTYATNLDWAGLKNYLLWRMSKGKIVQSDFDVVNNILKENWKIDLNILGGN